MKLRKHQYLFNDIPNKDKFCSQVLKIPKDHKGERPSELQKQGFIILSTHDMDPIQWEWSYWQTNC